MSMKLILAALAVAICASTALGSPLFFDVSSSEETLDMVEALEKQCLEKTGSAETFEQLVNGFAFLPMCVMGYLDLDGLSSSFNELDESNRVQFFDTYCPQFNESLQCMNPTLALLRTCWDGEELALLDVMINILPEALNMICKDHGEIFFRMGEPEYAKCMNMYDEYVVECSDKLSNDTEKMNLSSFGQEQCQELSEFRNCIADKFNVCNAPGLIDLLDLIYKPIAKAASCTKKLDLDLEQRNNTETNEI